MGRLRDRLAEDVIEGVIRDKREHGLTEEEELLLRSALKESLDRLDLIARREFYTLTEQIEIVKLHREGCIGSWRMARFEVRGRDWAERDEVIFYCKALSCPAEARIPEALLVELVSRKESES